MLIVRSLLVAVFLCLLGVLPQAAADVPCPALTPVPTPENGDGPPSGRLACADLHGTTVLHEDLSGEDLHGSDLTGASLPQTDLSGANLRDANLTGVDLSQADLRDADLRGATLTDASLIQADVHGADLRGAILDGADATQAFGLDSVRVDPFGPGTYLQVAYLLLGPAGVLALVWWRGRFAFLLRHRHTTRVRPVDLVAVGLGVLLAVTGLYLLFCGAFRGISVSAAGWLWALDPGPVAVDPVRQLVLGAVALVVSVFVLQVVRRRRPTRSPVDAGQVVVGKPAPGREFPVLGPRPRGVVALLGVLGLLDLIGVFVLWLLGLLPSHGVWGSDGVVGHLVVVLVITVVLIRAGQPGVDASAEVRALSGVVLVPGRSPYVWLSGTFASRDPANRVLPWDSLDHVYLIRTLGTASAGTAMFAAGGVEYSAELPMTPATITRLHAVLPEEKITEVVRAPSSG